MTGASCPGSPLCASLLIGHWEISSFLCHICLARCLASPQALSNRGQVRADETVSSYKPFLLQAVYSRHFCSHDGKVTNIITYLAVSLGSRVCFSKYPTGTENFNQDVSSMCTALVKSDAQIRSKNGLAVKAIHNRQELKQCITIEVI